MVRTDKWCLPWPDEGGLAASNGDGPGGGDRAAASSNGSSGSNGSGIAGSVNNGVLLPPLQGPGILEIKCPYNGGSPETARPPKRPQWWASGYRVSGRIQVFRGLLVGSSGPRIDVPEATARKQ